MIKIRGEVLIGLTIVLLVSVCIDSFGAVAESRKVYNVVNATYLHSNGETPSLGEVEEYPDGTPVILPILSNLTQAKGKIVSVDNVFGLKATLSNTTVLLTWNAVGRYTDLDSFNTVSLSVMNYVVYYSSASGSGYKPLFATPLNSQTSSCTHIIGVDSPTYYYTIVAVDDMDNTSGYSPEVDKSNNRFVHRDDISTGGDTYTCLFVPGTAATALYKGGTGNPYPGEDIHVDATRVSADEGKSKRIGTSQGLVATSISFDAYKYTNREKVSSFTFPAKVKITLRYEIENGLVKNTAIRSSQVKDKLGIFYFNGLEWVKLPAELDTAKQTLTTTVNHLSKYALIGGLANPTKLTLTGRIPPIFTPNGDGTNDYVIFTFEIPSTNKSSIKLRIFDLSGSLVREIGENDSGQSATVGLGGQMKWDGKDSSGTVMESGIYVYQIQAGSEYISGSVVLAK